MTDDIGKLLLEEAPDALLVVGNDGRITYANRAACNLLGYPRDQLLDMTVEELLPERHRSYHVGHRSRFVDQPTVREMGPRAVPLVALHRDGTELPVEIRLAPVPGARIGIVAAIRDVSERRRMTAELEAARESAVAANRAKSRFLAAASHDLRQPLQTLRLLNAALRRRLDDPLSSEIMAQQERALDSMTDLLNALLDISKLESGTVQPKLGDVSLADVLRDLRQQFESVAAARGLALAIDSPDWVLRTDRVLLREVLQNLVANALKFTERGSVTVRCSGARSAPIIEVTDTGPGIPADQLDRIFEEYYQAEEGRGSRTGFGLGLTIVKHVSRLLGYRIEVSSIPGQGTTFRVTVPPDQLLDRPATGQVIAEPVAGEPLSLKPALLIVEDDAAVRAALELLLGLEGYPTLVAASGEAAEDIFRREGAGIDVVITDFHLDGPRTGLQVLDALRKYAQRDLPAVFLSGDTSSTMATLNAVPRARILNKPVDVQRLVGAIEGLFAGVEGGLATD
jgi:PAS domain S-box-containing protein